MRISPEGVGHHSVSPLVRDGVELPEQLAHGDGLGVDDPVERLALVHLSQLAQEGQRFGKHLARGV